MVLYRRPRTLFAITVRRKRSGSNGIPRHRRHFGKASRYVRRTVSVPFGEHVQETAGLVRELDGRTRSRKFMARPNAVGKSYLVLVPDGRNVICKSNRARKRRITDFFCRPCRVPRRRDRCLTVVLNTRAGRTFLNTRRGPPTNICGGTARSP